MHSAVIIVLLTIELGTFRSSAAECFVLTGKHVLKSPGIEFVFSGRVVEYKTMDAAYRATFDVDRVWKGSVAKRIDIHVWQLEGEMPSYGKDERYVVLAKRLTDPRVRKAVGLGDTDAPALTPITCADALSPNIRRELGRGVPPKR